MNTHSSRFINPFYRGRLDSPLYGIPTGDNDLLHQMFIQCDEAQDMVTGNGKQRAERQGIDDKKRQVPQDLLADPLFEQFVIYGVLAHARLVHDPVPAKGRSVRRVVELLHKAEIERMAIK